MWVDIDDKRPPWAEKECSPTSRRRPRPMMPMADLFVHVYVLVDDALGSGAVAVPRRPGRPPACSDAEVLTLARGRGTCWPGPASGPSWPRSAATGRRTSRAARAERVQPPPALAVGGLRGPAPAASRPRCRQAPWQQVDTSALPVKHPSRVRGPDPVAGPGRPGGRLQLRRGAPRVVLRLPAGRCAPTWAPAWCGPGAWSRRPWTSGRVADGLLDGPPPAGLLLDRGFLGRAWAAGAPGAGHAGRHHPRPGRAPDAPAGRPPPRGARCATASRRPSAS